MLRACDHFQPTVAARTHACAHTHLCAHGSRVHAHMRPHACALTLARTRTHAPTCLRAHACAHTHTCAHMLARSRLRVHAHMRPHSCALTLARTRTHAPTCLRADACARTHTCAHMLARSRSRAHARASTHTRASCAHARTPADLMRPHCAGLRSLEPPDSIGSGWRHCVRGTWRVTQVHRGAQQPRRDLQGPRQLPPGYPVRPE